MVGGWYQVKEILDKLISYLPDPKAEKLLGEWNESREWAEQDMAMCKIESYLKEQRCDDCQCD